MYSDRIFPEATSNSRDNAAKAFADTNAKTLIPFHYGTYDAADEPLGEPAEILSKLNAEGKIENDLKILKLGEVFVV